MNKSNQNQSNREPKPRALGIEAQLVGKRVTIRSNDWSKAIVGTLRKVEKYLYVVESGSGTIIVMKHSVGSISGAKEEA